jgi:hypothetical protein
MQVFCKSSNENAEAYCSVCGQGFSLYWERQTRTERAAALREIDKTLRQHHYDHAGREAHPERAFSVPEQSRFIGFSGAAVRGAAPSWAL